MLSVLSVSAASTFTRPEFKAKFGHINPSIAVDAVALARYIPPCPDCTRVVWANIIVPIIKTIPRVQIAFDKAWTLT